MTHKQEFKQNKEEFVCQSGDGLGAPCIHVLLVYVHLCF